MRARARELSIAIAGGGGGCGESRLRPLACVSARRWAEGEKKRLSYPPFCRRSRCVKACARVCNGAQRLRRARKRRERGRVVARARARVNAIAFIDDADRLGQSPLDRRRRRTNRRRATMSAKMQDDAADYKQLLAEADALRRLAFFGVFVSTIATLTAAIAIPMLYNYSIHVNSALQDELQFCTHRTSNLYAEFQKVRRRSLAEMRTIWVCSTRARIARRSCSSVSVAAQTNSTSARQAASARLAMLRRASIGECERTMPTSRKRQATRRPALSPPDRVRIARPTDTRTRWRPPSSRAAKDQRRQAAPRLHRPALVALDLQAHLG